MESYKSLTAIRKNSALISRTTECLPVVFLRAEVLAGERKAVVSLVTLFLQRKLLVCPVYHSLLNLLLKCLPKAQDDFFPLVCGEF